MDVDRTIDALWRIESPKLVASMTRVVGDLGTAEDLVSEAFVAAVEQWPTEGIPPKPGAWLMTTARHKAVDRIRREETSRRKYALVAAELHHSSDAADVAEEALGAVPDDLLTWCSLPAIPYCHVIRASR